MPMETATPCSSRPSINPWAICSSRGERGIPLASACHSSVVSRTEGPDSGATRADAPCTQPLPGALWRFTSMAFVESAWRILHFSLIQIIAQEAHHVRASGVFSLKPMECGTSEAGTGEQVMKSIAFRSTLEGFVMARHNNHPTPGRSHGAVVRLHVTTYATLSGSPLASCRYPVAALRLPPATVGQAFSLHVRTSGPAHA